MHAYLGGVGQLYHSYHISFLYQVFMWGQCHGLTLLAPRQVAVASLDEVFACFGMPQIMFRPVKLGMILNVVGIEALYVFAIVSHLQ